MASRSTTSSKPTAAATAAAKDNGKDDAAPAKPDLEVVTEKTAAEIVSVELKKQELLQMVADRAELNKNKVKPVVEAMLEVLGEALAEGRELNLKPFGKVKINRQKDVGNARVTVAKIRQSKADRA